MITTTTVLSLFEIQAKEQAQATAIIQEERSLSYAELNKKANQLAHYLRAEYEKQFFSSFKAETPIAFMFERSIEAVIVMLGILKAGGCYVSLDPDAPEQRKNLILENSRAQILLTHSQYNYVGLPNSKVLHFDQLQSILDSQSEENIQLTISADQAAYIVYTSGSTGVPKGVIALHRGIVRLVYQTNYVQITKKARMAHLANLVFDAVTFEVFAPLTNGAVLVIAPLDIIESHEHFRKYLLEQRISILFITTALFDRFAKNDLATFKSLEYLLVGGETMDAVLAAQVANDERYKPIHFYNVYGPTENTTFSTFFEIHHIEDLSKSVPIGHFISGTFGYIFDQEQQECDEGVPGELYLGGLGLARGYVNAPELTAKSFITHPVTGEQLYRTGDLVKQLSSQGIEFLGRLDTQIKIRGFRVELGEIEQVIAMHPDIEQGVVIATTDSLDKKFLVAYCVVRKGGAQHPVPNLHAFNDNQNDYLYSDSCDEKNEAYDFFSVKQFVEERLPAYMCPTIYQQLEEIPLTPTGKIDRKSLQSIEVASFLNAQNEQCIDSAQLKLVRLWGEVFNVENMPPNAHFFNLGGNSISAVDLIYRIQQVFDVHVPVSWVFRHPTIVGQTQSLRDQVRGDFRYTPIIPFHQQGDSVSLYMVHPGLIGAECYSQLAYLLSKKINFYGIDSYNLYNDPMKEDIKELAQYYADHLLKSNIPSRVFLGGWSMGGLIAYEMAKLLGLHGVKVKKLFLIDPDPPSYENQLVNDQSVDIKMLNNTPPYIMNYLATVPEAVLQKIQSNLMQEIHLCSKYRPEPNLNLDVILFEAKYWNQSSFLGKKADLAGQWKNYVRSLGVITLPGDHLSIMDGQNIKLIAMHLNQALSFD